jgi:hypothetical protein
MAYDPNDPMSAINAAVDYTGNLGAMDQWGSEPLSISGNPQSNYVDDAPWNTSTTGGPASGMNWGALGGLKGALGDAAKTLGNQSQPTKQQINMAQAQRGSPIDRASLSQLVQMLQQRDQSYYPTGGQVGARPVQIPRTLGLLGF